MIGEVKRKTKQNEIYANLEVVLKKCNNNTKTIIVYEVFNIIKCKMTLSLVHILYIYIFMEYQNA